MNFNFNIKDMLSAAGPSIRRVPNARDLHHTGKCGVKRGSRSVTSLTEIVHELKPINDCPSVRLLGHI